jgi:hypothetical protein
MTTEMPYDDYSQSAGLFKFWHRFFMGIKPIPLYYRAWPTPGKPTKKAGEGKHFFTALFCGGKLPH